MGFQLNAVSLSGSLVRDPETRALPSGTSITVFSIAHNERRKVNDEWTDVAHFVDITLFGKQGEWLRANASKGDPIAISGSLEQQRWQDKTSGDARSKVSIVARDVFLGQRANGGTSSSSSTQGGQQSTGYGSSDGYASSGYGDQAQF